MVVPSQTFRKFQTAKQAGLVLGRMLLAAAACAVLGLFVVWATRRSPDSAQQPASPPVAKPAGTPPVVVSATPFTQPILTSLPPRTGTPDPNVAAKARTFDTFKRHPFEAVKKAGANAWTTEDGRSPEVIRQLAHNELEAERMTAENASIKRRQLVYRNEPIATTVQRARSTGQPVQSFTLPGLDGQEYVVEVTQNSVEPVIAAGSLMGHLKDRPNSTVSIGFKDGYESFNILSPDDSLYLAADAREPGEVMVKEIIPGKYGASAMSDAPDFILTK